MLLHTAIYSPPLHTRSHHRHHFSFYHSFSFLPFGSLKFEPPKPSVQECSLLGEPCTCVPNSLSLSWNGEYEAIQDRIFFQSHNPPDQISSRENHILSSSFCSLQADIAKGFAQEITFFKNSKMSLNNPFSIEEVVLSKRLKIWVSSFSSGLFTFMIASQAAHARGSIKSDAVYEVGELFELGIQLSYLLLLLALLGAGTFFVIRQVLVRRELDLSAKELQEQVRSGDASATEFFELGAVMLRRKFYPAAIKYLLQAIEKWDGDDQDLAQVYNALGVSYVLDGKLEKGIAQFEMAVKLQPGYVTAWNNLGDAYEKKNDLKSALKAFEEVLLFDPNNKVARPRRDSLKDKVKMYRGVPVKSKDR